ncbi:MAG: hypothetical protein AAF997_14360 [Myxococcota bacterium]
MTMRQSLFPVPPRGRGLPRLVAGTEPSTEFDGAHSILARHLPVFILDPGRIAYLRHPLLPDPGPVDSLLRRVAEDKAESVDIGAVGKEVRVRLEGSQGTFHLVALVDGYDDQRTLMLAIDDTFRLRTLTQTQVLERAGVLQLYGAPLGVAALTEGQMRAQVGQTLYRDSNVIRRLTVERYVGGAWVSQYDPMGVGARFDMGTRPRPTP